jgi:hypothetical protein
LDQVKRRCFWFMPVFFWLSLWLRNWIQFIILKLSIMFFFKLKIRPEFGEQKKLSVTVHQKSIFTEINVCA